MDRLRKAAERLADVAGRFAEGRASAADVDIAVFEWRQASPEDPIEKELADRERAGRGSKEQSDE